MSATLLFALLKAFDGIAARDLSPAHRLILLALADFADDNARAWPSAETLATRTGQSRSTVQVRLAELELAGWVAGERRRKGNRPDSTVYEVRSTGNPVTRNAGPGAVSDSPATRPSAALVQPDAMALSPGHDGPTTGPRSTTIGPTDSPTTGQHGPVTGPNPINEPTNVEPTNTDKQGVRAGLVHEGQDAAPGSPRTVSINCTAEQVADELRGHPAVVTAAATAPLGADAAIADLAEAVVNAAGHKARPWRLVAKAIGDAVARVSGACAGSGGVLWSEMSSRIVSYVNNARDIGRGAHTPSVPPASRPPSPDETWAADRWIKARAFANLPVGDPDPKRIAALCEKASNALAYAKPDGNGWIPNLREIVAHWIRCYLRDKQDRPGGIRDANYPLAMLVARCPEAYPLPTRADCVRGSAPQQKEPEPIDVIADVARRRAMPVEDA